MPDEFVAYGLTDKEIDDVGLAGVAPLSLAAVLANTPAVGFIVPPRKAGFACSSAPRDSL